MHRTYWTNRLIDLGFKENEEIEMSFDVEELNPYPAMELLRSDGWNVHLTRGKLHAYRTREGKIDQCKCVEQNRFGL